MLVKFNDAFGFERYRHITTRKNITIAVISLGTCSDAILSALARHVDATVITDKPFGSTEVFPIREIPIRAIELKTAPFEEREQQPWSKQSRYKRKF